MIKNLFLCIAMLTFYNLEAQSLDAYSYPTIYHNGEVRKWIDSVTIWLEYGAAYDPKARGIEYSGREKNKDNIDTLLCQYQNLLYLKISDDNFNFDLLECVKDSLKYLNIWSSFSKNIDFELPNLEEIVGKMDMKLLATLLSNSPNITSFELLSGGKMKHLEGIEVKHLITFWILSEENCFCRNNLKLPNGLFNAPNVEIMNIQHYCKRNNKYRRDRALLSDKHFAMPEIKSDSSKLTYLHATCLDIGNPHTLEQIKKLKKLEYLYISFSGADYSIFDDLSHIKEIRLDYPRGWKFHRNYKKRIKDESIDTDEEFKKKYPNILFGF